MVDLLLPTNTSVHPDKARFLPEENPFEAMMARFDRAAELLDLEPGLYKVLRNPEKTIIVSIPVVALFMYLQKYLVAGLTAGAVKG